MFTGPRRTAAAALLAAAGACLVTPGTASAHASMPSAPTALHVVKVSPSSFTISANGDAREFRLYAAFRRTDLAVKHLATSNAKHSPLRPNPTLTLKHLSYTTKPMFYRIEARNGTRHRFSAIDGTVSLQPPTPTNLAASSGAGGTVLTWDAQRKVTGYRITQASDAAMTQDVKTYTTANQDNLFSPPGLDRGSVYYFTISSLNGATPSPASSPVSVLADADAQPLTVMTYNILEASAAGRSEGGNTVAPWSQRRQPVVDTITKADPDIVSIQEGSNWVADVKGPRQVDDLVSALGGTYALARTEVPPTEPHYMRTGCYILYKPTLYDPVGDGDHFALGDSRYAAWQILQNKATGVEFMVVAPHLLVPKGGDTDQRREDETQSMVEQASRIADPLGIPVVYAGDFNSDTAPAHAFNGPSDYMLPHGIDDSFDVAQSRTNADYDSANNYQTQPPKHHQRIDYVYVTPGVAVTAWAMELNLHRGKVVGVIPSDHNAVMATLELPYQGVS